MFVRRALLAVLAAVSFVALDRAEAQTFPDKLIKIVVPYPPGGPSDVAARLVAQPMAAILGQPVIVENIAGAGGRIGAKAVAQANADGYTLFLGGTNPNAIAPSIYPNLTFEPMKDFRAVGVVSFDSNVLVVNAAVPVKTIQELLQYAKDNPGKLSSGATLGIGPHVSLELLRARTGSNMNFIPYRGAAPAITDLLGNQIQVGMSSKAVMLPLINAGQAERTGRHQRRALAGTAGRADPAGKQIRGNSGTALERAAGARTDAGRRDRQTQCRNDRGHEDAGGPGEPGQAGPQDEGPDAATVRRRAGGGGPHLGVRRQGSQH